MHTHKKPPPPSENPKAADTPFPQTLTRSASLSTHLLRRDSSGGGRPAQRRSPPFQSIILITEIPFSSLLLPLPTSTKPVASLLSLELQPCFPMPFIPFLFRRTRARPATFSSRRSPSLFRRVWLRFGWWTAAGVAALMADFRRVSSSGEAPASYVRSKQV